MTNINRAILSQLAIVLLATVACRKQDNPTGDLSDSPVFSLNATTDLGPVSISAGQDNWYMFTDFSADSTGTNKFLGYFAPASCAATTCPNAVSFTLQQNALEGIPVNREYDYLQGWTGLPFYKYTLQFLLSETENRKVLLEVNGMPVDPQNSFTNSYTGSANMEIRISAIDTVNGLKSQSIHTFMPTAPDSCKSIQLIAIVNDTTVTLHAELAIPQPNFQWYNGATGSDLVQPYDKNISYSVTASSPDAGCVATASLSNLPGNEGTPTTFKSTGDEILLQLQPVVAAEGVAIEWARPNGTIISSRNIIQPSDGYFILENIRPYLLNEKGQSTQQLNIRFKCLMADEQGENSSLFTGTATIGVADPR